MIRRVRGAKHAGRMGVLALALFTPALGGIACSSDSSDADGSGTATGGKSGGAGAGGSSAGGASASGGAAGSAGSGGSGGDAGSAGNGGSGGTTGSAGSSATGGSGGSGGTPGGGRANPCDAPRAGPFFHVSESGTDNPDCSQAAPCRTLQHAADVVDAAGAVVLVENGTYDGFHSVHAHVTFAADGDSVVVNTSHSWSSGTPGDNINVEGTDGVTIDGFRVPDATRSGIRVVDATDVVVCNNVVGPSGMWGILTGFAPRVQIFANETRGSAGEHGIYVGNSNGPGDAPVIASNHSHDNNVNGIQLNGDCQAGGDGSVDAAILDGNVVHDNGGKGLSLISAPGVRVENNVIYENGKNAGAGGIHLVKQPACPDDQASSDGVIVNNTVVEPRIAALRANDGATRNVIFNNIFVSPHGAPDDFGGNDFSNNLLAGAATGLFAAGGFELAPTSAARNACVASYAGKAAPTYDIVGTSRQANSCDQGAYEAP